MSPAQVDECSFWQLNACVEGFNKANGSEDKLAPPTNEEFDAMVARLH